MKKLIAAASAAVMVFAFAAFAATFTVDASVLAVGEADVGNCTENVEIISYGYEGDSQTIGNVSVSLDQACYDEHGGDAVIFAHFFDAGGDAFGRTEETIIPDDGVEGERLTLSIADVMAAVDGRLAVGPIESVVFGIHTKTDA